MELIRGGPGRVVHLEFEKGEQFTLSTQFYGSAGTLVTTITSARLVFREGTPAAPGAAVSGVSVSVSVNAGTTMSWTITSAMTSLAAFAVGSDYCWLLEATLADGTIATIFKGSVTPLTEVA